MQRRSSRIVASFYLHDSVGAHHLMTKRCLLVLYRTSHAGLMHPRLAEVLGYDGLPLRGRRSRKLIRPTFDSMARNASIGGRGDALERNTEQKVRS